MGHSRNTERVLCDERGREGRLGNVLGPKLGPQVLQMRSHLTWPEKQGLHLSVPRPDQITLKPVKVKLRALIFTGQFQGPGQSPRDGIYGKVFFFFFFLLSKICERRMY